MPQDTSLLEEYRHGWRVPDVMALNGDPAPGIVTTHDQFAISWSRDDMIDKVHALLASRTEDDARKLFRLCGQSQWDYGRAKRELGDGSWISELQPIHYRPFDIRWTVYDRNVAVHRRERVMRHMKAGYNIAIITARQQSQHGVPWRLVGVANNVIECCAISNKTKEINYLLPLYLYSGAARSGLFDRLVSSGSPGQRKANLDGQ